MSTRTEGVGYIGLDRKLDDFYVERIFNASNIFGQTEIGKYYHTTVDENTLKEYIQNIKSYGKKVVTYWSHNSNSLYKAFIELMKKESLTTDKYPIVLLEGSLTSDELKSANVDPAKNQGNYQISGYDISFSNEDSDYYKDNYYSLAISPYEEVFVYKYLIIYTIIIIDWD